MSKDLMTPRYLVIADYPDSPFSIDDIIGINTDRTYYRYGSECIASGMELDEDESFYKSYPHLFRPLNWWEFRDEKDMPEYVKYNSGLVMKVKKWVLSTIHIDCRWTPTYDGYIMTITENILPATESDFINIKNKR